MTAPVPAPRDLNEVFFGGGTPADHSELTALGLPAGLSTVDVLNAAAGSRNATFVPIADSSGAALLTGQPNPVTGRPDMTVLEFPNDTIAFAVALAGETFPRFMFQPTKGMLTGDGTSQPSETSVVQVAKPTGVAATDTAILQTALNAISPAASIIQSAGGPAAASVPTLVLPVGHYVINDTLTYPGYCRIVSDGETIIEQTNAAKDILSSAGAYMLYMRGVILAGGKRQVVIGNNNVDTSMVTLDRCEFQTNNGDYMIDTVPTAPATSMSCNLKLDNCKITNPYKVLHNCLGVDALVKDTWVSISANGADAAMFWNENLLILSRMYGVPNNAGPSAHQRWIDNYFQVYAIDGCRFGGEGAGMPIVYNYAGAEQAFPFDGGGAVVIKDSFVAPGPTGNPNSAVVNLQTALPQQISIRDNFGVTCHAGQLIVDSIPGGVGPWLAGTTVTAGSNGVNVNTFAGAGVLNVADTASLSAAGTVYIGTGGGLAQITYTGKTANTLTGCTNVSFTGTGVLATGAPVDQNFVAGADVAYIAIDNNQGINVGDADIPAALYSTDPNKVKVWVNAQRSLSSSVVNRIVGMVSGDQTGLRLENLSPGGRTWRISSGVEGSSQVRLQIRDITTGVDALVILSDVAGEPLLFNGFGFNGGGFVWGGTGVPAGGFGFNNDYYFRADGAAGAHIYFKSGGAWAAIA